MFSDSALVVVDMQSLFLEAYEIAIKVAREVKNTVRLNQPVFILEFSGFGSTDSSILRQVTGYHRVHFVKKTEMDGSHGIANICNQIGFFPLTWKICGIYTNSCVFATAHGLRGYFPQSQLVILKDAVLDPSLYYTKSQNFKHFESLGQTIIL
jgi:nicotinamidase-related amidase